MAKDQQMQMPGVFGGLMRYNEGYESNFKFKPSAVIIYIVVIALAVIAMKIFFPVQPFTPPIGTPNIPIHGGWIFLLLGKLRK